MSADDDYIPAPYPPDEEARQRAVKRLLAFDFDLTELDGLVAEVADLFDVPMAAATVLDDDRQLFASKKGIEAPETDRAVAFCGYTISQKKPFCVPDAKQDARFAGNPLVVRDPSIRFYAGARIMVDGMPVGALCAIGQQAQKSIDDARLDRLERLASSASDILNRQLNGNADDPENSSG